MDYISPLHSLNLDANTTLDKASLNLAKKKILAEMELSTQGTIELGGQTMTKHDVLQWFDGLAKMQNWSYHQAIALDKALLNFLEKSKLNTPYTFLNQAIYSDEAFVAFVSPYFLEKYKENLIKYLQIGDAKLLKNVLNVHPLLLTDYDRYDVWQAVELFIDNKIENINHATQEVEDNRKAKATFDVAALHHSAFIACLNALPEHFFSIRDCYARALYNLSAVQWNNGSKPSATTLVKDATLLQVFAETQEMLKERLAWFANQQKGTTSSSSDSDTSWSGVGKLVFYLFIVVLNIGRFSNGCDKSYASYNQYTPRIERDVFVKADDASAPPEAYHEPSTESKIWAEAYLKNPQEEFNAFLQDKNKLRNQIVVHKIVKYQGTLYMRSPMGRLSSKNQALAQRIYNNLYELRAATSQDGKYLKAMMAWFLLEVNTKGCAKLENFPKE